jgi:hypothetical protein
LVMKVRLIPERKCLHVLLFKEARRYFELTCSLCRHSPRDINALRGREVGFRPAVLMHVVVNQNKPNVNSDVFVFDGMDDRIGVEINCLVNSLVSVRKRKTVVDIVCVANPTALWLCFPAGVLKWTSRLGWFPLEKRKRSRRYQGCGVAVRCVYL